MLFYVSDVYGELENVAILDLLMFSMVSIKMVRLSETNYTVSGRVKSQEIVVSSLVNQ